MYRGQTTWRWQKPVIVIHYRHSHCLPGLPLVSGVQDGQYLSGLVQVIGYQSRGVTRSAVNLLRITRQRQSVVSDQLTQPVLYIQQQTVKLIRGG